MFFTATQADLQASGTGESVRLKAIASLMATFHHPVVVRHLFHSGVGQGLHFRRVRLTCFANEILNTGA